MVARADAELHGAAAPAQLTPLRTPGRRERPWSVSTLPIAARMAQSRPRSIAGAAIDREVLGWDVGERRAGGAVGIEGRRGSPGPEEGQDGGDQQGADHDPAHAGNPDGADQRSRRDRRSITLRASGSNRVGDQWHPAQRSIAVTLGPADVVTMTKVPR